MDWDNLDTIPGTNSQGLVDHGGPTTVMGPAAGDATMAPSMGLMFDTTPYCLQPHAPFGLLTPSPYPQNLTGTPALGVSGDSYFPPTTPLGPGHSGYWLDPSATDATQRSLFQFQQELQPPPALASNLSPTLTAGDSSTASWTPSPPPHLLPPPLRSKKSEPASTNTAMARTKPCKKPPSPTKTAKAPNKNNSKRPKETGRPKGQLNPSNFDTLEEYQSELRLWHNRIGKKYRNKLNSQFESLYAVLNPEDDDKDPVVVRGRTINKARTLDMARQRILDLTHENNTMRAEMEQMIRLLKTQKNG
ncbi:hypothetical protein QBC43DRAFT_118156 [Cladorrhinum sp. PSN259]|nr:hypothetical protein QBC43DRAFT_118156 [Cladorrhinum sp. PSN259]